MENTQPTDIRSPFKSEVEINNMLYAIDRNVPIPPRISKKRGIWTPVVQAMNIGDSIMFPTRSEAAKLMAALRHKGWKTCCRKQKAGTFRVWKLEPKNA